MTKAKSRIRLTWTRVPRPNQLRPGRDRYITPFAGGYEILWHGSTHGVWVLSHAGRELRVTALLSQAKQEAQNHVDKHYRNA